MWHHWLLVLRFHSQHSLLLFFPYSCCTFGTKINKSQHYIATINNLFVQPEMTAHFVFFPFLDLPERGVIFTHAECSLTCNRMTVATCCCLIFSTSVSFAVSSSWTQTCWDSMCCFSIVHWWTCPMRSVCLICNALNSASNSRCFRRPDCT